jgi:hypothetical protein
MYKRKRTNPGRASVCYIREFAHLNPKCFWFTVQKTYLPKAEETVEELAAAFWHCSFAQMTKD